MVVPSWTAFAAISAVCLDLRGLQANGPGPLLATYVTRPTCRSELLRQAGLFGTRPCRVYLGTEIRPLEEDEEVTLSNGCVITFVQDDTLPDFSTDLQYRTLSCSFTGVLAFVEPTLIPPEMPQYVVFLDLRQVASSIKFLVLGQPFIPRADLPNLIKQKPPPGWFLRVSGGRMRRHRLDFRHGATLVFGFEYSLDSDQPSEHFSPTTEASDEDSEEEHRSDDQDTTTAPADSEGEHLFPALAPGAMGRGHPNSI
ncbi:ANK1 [Symbiodinium sp. CCMP2592]|nr:ANK1 [Symbiodinium sp. CCMP2592]CAE7472816.1 ANK1 [Symbiodinium sp. CCMP2592]